MGSILTFNDTLNLTPAHGFPADLVLAKHLETPYKAADFEGRTFNFTKPDLRFYHSQPIRVYLVENINDRWVYWGMTHVLNVTLDYVKKTTSGTFKIVDIFSPEDMRKAFDLRDARSDFDYWK